ncbi:hypothetical protein [Lacrimispora sp.]
MEPGFHKTGKHRKGRIPVICKKIMKAAGRLAEATGILKWPER